MSDNPYAAQINDQESLKKGDHGLRISDGLLVIPKGTKLPDICIITGRRGTGKYFTKEFSWAPNWVYFMILINLLVLLIAYIATKKSGKMEYYFDKTIIRERYKYLTINWLLLGLSVLCVVFAVLFESGLIASLIILFVIAMLVVWAVKLTKIKVAKIDMQFIYLKGIKPEIMDSIVESN